MCFTAKWAANKARQGIFLSHKTSIFLGIRSQLCGQTKNLRAHFFKQALILTGVLSAEDVDKNGMKMSWFPLL